MDPPSESNFRFDPSVQFRELALLHSKATRMLQHVALVASAISAVALAAPLATPAQTEVEVVIDELTPIKGSPGAFADNGAVSSTSATKQASLSICAKPPVGFCDGHAIVPNVAYAVPAMYDCNVGETMLIWCEQSPSDPERHRYMYCCDDRCTGIPKGKTCKVQGQSFNVGVAYENVVLALPSSPAPDNHRQKNNNKDKSHIAKSVTIWCTSESEFRTCTPGVSCGSTLELTPPGLEVCPVDPDVMRETLRYHSAAASIEPRDRRTHTTNTDALNAMCRKCVTGGNGVFDTEAATCHEDECAGPKCVARAEDCPYSVR